MRHRVSGRKLGRTTSHRRAMFRNQLASFIEHERIRTTLHKAKELRPLAEKMITQGKRDTLHARRQVRRWVDDRSLIQKLFDDIAPRLLGSGPNSNNLRRAPPRGANRRAPRSTCR